LDGVAAINDQNIDLASAFISPWLPAFGDTPDYYTKLRSTQLFDGLRMDVRDPWYLTEAILCCMGRDKTGSENSDISCAVFSKSRNYLFVCVTRPRFRSNSNLPFLGQGAEWAVRLDFSQLHDSNLALDGKGAISFASALQHSNSAGKSSLHIDLTESVSRIPQCGTSMGIVSGRISQDLPYCGRVQISPLLEQ
jgi:hypothetical protein